MKKKLFIIFIFFICICSVFIFYEHKPFKSLKSSDIISAEVCLSPPDKSVPVNDLDTLVDCLNEIVVYNEDKSYKEYAGQAAIFNISMSDGSKVEITAYNPFIIINGKGYKAKYQPCEELNMLANKILNNYN